MTTTAKYDNRIGNRRQSPHRGAARGRSLRGRAQSGASLIEIMIVLIILLIGVFLAIRIFPAGFGVLSANDNRSRAVRLAEQLIGDTRNNAANLPQGVLMAGPMTNSTTIAPILNQDPDSLATYTYADNTTVSDVNRTRFIKGEPVRIPVATSTIGTGNPGFSASQYILRFGPISLDPTVGTRATAPTAAQTALFSSYLNVVSAPLVGYTVASNNPAITAQTTQTTPTGAQTATPTGSTAPPLGPDGITNVSGYLRGQTSYLVDYSSNGNPAVIMFEGGSDTVNGVTFEVSYSYQSSTGVVASVTDQQIFVNQSSALPINTPVWQGLPLPGGGIAINVVPGSVSVRRAFTRVAYPTSTTPWSSSPYEYCLGQDNNASSSANVGQLYFNPAGANYSVPGPSGQQPFMAYVDYSVLDWHILHDDVQVPSVSTGSLGLIPVKTTFNLIKRIGDANPDQTIYSGLFPNDQFPTDIAIFNLGTGALLTNGPGAGNANVIHGVPNPTVTATSPDYYIDTDPHQGTYATGTIYLNPITVPAGSQLRILYKTDGDWAVALQKAYAQYMPVVGQTTTPTWIDTTSGMTTSGTFSASSLFSIDSTLRRIYFPRCDINKSVVVTLQYKNTGNTATRYVKTAPLQFTIDNADGAYAYIDLVNPGTANSNVLSNADQTGINSDANWSVVGPIIGVSVKARVIYKDNNNPNNSWRVQDIDTYLTPGS